MTSLSESLRRYEEAEKKLRIYGPRDGRLEAFIKATEARIEAADALRAQLPKDELAQGVRGHGGRPMTLQECADAEAAPLPGQPLFVVPRSDAEIERIMAHDPGCDSRNSVGAEVYPDDSQHHFYEACNCTVRERIRDALRGSPNKE